MRWRWLGCCSNKPVYIALMSALLRWAPFLHPTLSLAGGWFFLHDSSLVTILMTLPPARVSDLCVQLPVG